MPDELKQRFEQASKDVTTLAKRPDDGTMLELYALYKQGTQGDLTGKRPGLLNLVGRAKYDAWAKLKGKPSADAMQSYVALVERLLGGR